MYQTIWARSKNPQKNYIKYFDFSDFHPYSIKANYLNTFYLNLSYLSVNIKIHIVGIMEATNGNVMDVDSVGSSGEFT